MRQSAKYYKQQCYLWIFKNVFLVLLGNPYVCRKVIMNNHDILRLELPFDTNWCFQTASWGSITESQEVEGFHNGCPALHFCVSLHLCTGSHRESVTDVGGGARRLVGRSWKGQERGVWLDRATAGGRAQERKEKTHMVEGGDLWKGKRKLWKRLMSSWRREGGSQR